MSERAAAPAASPAATVESPVAIAAPSPGQAGGPGIVCIRAPDGIVVTLQLAPGEIDRDMRRFSKISLTDEEGNSVVLETGSLYTSSHIPITDVGASTFACGYVQEAGQNDFRIFLGYLNKPFTATTINFEPLLYGEKARVYGARGPHRVLRVTRKQFVSGANPLRHSPKALGPLYM